LISGTGGKNNERIHREIAKGTYDFGGGRTAKIGEGGTRNLTKKKQRSKRKEVGKDTFNWTWTRKNVGGLVGIKGTNEVLGSYEKKHNMPRHDKSGSGDR